MKVWIIFEGCMGGFVELQLIEKIIFVVGLGQVKIKVKVCLINYWDIIMLMGLYFSGLVLWDMVLLFDGVGEVVEVGEGVI